MELNIPVIAVVGHKKTGKTFIIERVIRDAKLAGYSIASGKHVSDADFSIDKEATDSWRFSKAGAKAVTVVSEKETALILLTGLESFSVTKLLKYLYDVDFLILEGFSEKVLADQRVAKVVCVKDAEGYHHFLGKIKGEIIGFFAFQPNKKYPEAISDPDLLSEKILIYIRKEKILKTLPYLDCGKCGYRSCREMAEAISTGKRSLKDCLILKNRKPLKIELRVDDVRIPIQPFVSNIIRSAVLGMVSTLKGVSIEGNERVSIKIA